jgi:hypothetical protein
MVALSILKSKGLHMTIVAALFVGGGVWLYKHFQPPKTTTTTVAGTKEVTVAAPVLTTKVVDRIVVDPKQQAVINQLIKENNALKLKVTRVTSTVATNTTTGGTASSNPSPGTITQVVRVPQATQPLNPNDVGSWSFKDWQLMASYSPTDFSYSLSQSFRIVTTTAKDGTELLKLVQDTPKGPVDIATTTTVIQADPTLARFFISPRVQGGFGIDQAGVKGGFIGVQWLKHGSSNANEDIRWGIATPGVFIQTGKVAPVLLPISLNVGTIKYVPFTNLWISPFIDLTKRAGFVLTATF